MEDKTKSHTMRVKPRSTYFIQEKNLLKWLSIVLMPFLICIIVAIADTNFAIWLPSFSMYQCGDWKNGA